MLRAKVKWFNPLIGYGYLIMQDGREVFFHRSETDWHLNTGDAVLFELYETGKGLSAKKVRLDRP